MHGQQNVKKYSSSTFPLFMLVFSSATSLEAIKICMALKRYAQLLQISERLSPERMEIPD